MAVTQKRIEALTRYWRKRLHLHEWRISIKVGEFEDEGRFAKLSAANVAEPDYLEATVYYDPDRIREAKEDLNRLTCHELLHCHTAELVTICDQWAGDDPIRQRMVKHAHEQLVSRLERILTDG